MDNATLEELRFLADVQARVLRNPQLFARIVDACQAGVTARIETERQRAADFETVASAFASLAGERRVTPALREWAERLILSKTSKWLGDSAIPWSSNPAVVAIASRVNQNPTTDASSV